MKAGSFVTMVIILSALLASNFLTVSATTSSYASSGTVLRNIQVSSPIFGGATDRTGACVQRAAYNNHVSESWIAVDPSNPNHLVGMSKFFFDSEFYLFHVGAHVSWDGGRSWSNVLVKGFDCQSAPHHSWVSSTDPVLAFDSNGALYSAMLAFNLKYNSTGDQVGVSPDSEIAVVKSTDGGLHWKIANHGQPLAFYPNNNVTADKQWIAVDSNPDSPFAGHIYVAWSVFDSNGSEIWFSTSRDHGEHFTTPRMISDPSTDGPSNTYVFLGTGPDGTLYSVYTSFPSSNSSQADVWVLRSRDGGRAFSAPRLAASFNTLSTFDLPNTTFRDGISDNFAVDRFTGHLFLTLEVDSSYGLDVKLTESQDGGNTWSTPVFVNDQSTVADGIDQFQPTVAVSPDGVVAVAFYDRRLSCPFNDPNILPDDAGRTNFCINASLQFYEDGSRGLKAVGSNLRVSRASWDPQNPGATTHQLPRPSGPNGNETFIGDYFGLALTNQKAYVLFASNYNLGHNNNNNQEQFLGTVLVPHGNDQGEQTQSRCDCLATTDRRLAFAEHPDRT